MTTMQQVYNMAQTLAIKLNAKSVTYDLKKETWTYICPNETIKYTKKEIENFIKKHIDSLINVK